MDGREGRGSDFTWDIQHLHPDESQVFTGEAISTENAIIIVSIKAKVKPISTTDTKY